MRLMHGILRFLSVFSAVLAKMPQLDLLQSPQSRTI